MVAAIPEVFTKLAADADAPDASAANVGTAHTDNTSAAVKITAKNALGYTHRFFS